MVELLLLSCACLSGTIAARAWLRPLSANEDGFSGVTGGSTISDTVDAEELADMSAQVVEQDPFRLERHPSGVPFLSEPENQIETQKPQQPPRPALAVSGIVGGPPWIAILTGVPGRAGAAVVREGDSFADLVVRSVSQHGVVVSAPDTVWRLVMRRQQ